MLVWGLICLMGVAHTTSPFLEANRGNLVLTADLRDVLQVPLNLFFEFPSIIRPPDLAVEVRNLGEDRPVKAQLDIVEDVVAEPGSTAFKSVLLLSFRFSDGWQRQLDGNFASFCLFVWKKSMPATIPSVEDREAYQKTCGLLRLRMANLSIPTTNLPAYSYNASISFDSGPGMNSISFDSFTNGHFSENLMYDMACNDTASLSRANVTVPELQVVATGIKQNFFGPYQFSNFAGTKQHHIGEYIIDFDLERRFFKIRNASTLRILKGVSSQQLCREVVVFSDFGPKRNLFIACISEKQIELIQVTLFDVDGMVHGLTERATKMGFYTDCKYFELPQVLYCQSKLPDSSDTNQTEEWPAYESIKVVVEPLELSSEKIVLKSTIFRFFESQTPTIYRDRKLRPVVGGVWEDSAYFELLLNNQRVGFVLLDGKGAFRFNTVPANQLRITIHEFGSATSDTEEVLCVIPSGIFMHDPAKKHINFRSVASRSMILLKDYSSKKGDLHSFTCQSTTNTILLNFHYKNASLPRRLKEVSSVVVGVPSSQDATIREYIDIDYLAFAEGTNEVFARTWMAYFDPDAFALHWHYVVKSPENQYSGFLKSSVKLRERKYVLSTGDPGTYRCVLSGKPLIEADESSSSVNVTVRVAETLSVKAEKTDLVMKPIKLSRNSPSKFNHTVHIEDHFRIEGALLDAKLRRKFTPQRNDQKLVFFPRQQLKYFAQDKSGEEQYERLVWIDSHRMLGVQNTNIHLLLRNDSDHQSFAKNHTFDLRKAVIRYPMPSDMDYFRECSGISLFIPESADQTPILVAFTNTLKQYTDIRGYRVETRAMIVAALDNLYSQVTTFGVFFQEVPFGQSKLRWLSQKYLDPEENKIQILSSVYAVAESGQLKIDSQTISYNYKTQQWAYLSVKKFEQPAITRSPLSEIILWNLTVGSPSLLVVHLSKYELKVQEHQFMDLGPPSAYLVEHQRMRLENLPSRPAAFNCSTLWSLCVVAFESGIFVSCPFDANPVSCKWEVRWDQRQVHRLPFQHRPKTVLFGEQHLILKSEIPNSGIFVYRRGHLDSPYVNLTENYDSSAVLTFGRDQKADGSGWEEVLLLTQQKTAPIVYSLRPLSLVFTNFTAADFEEPIAFTLEHSPTDSNTTITVLSFEVSLDASRGAADEDGLEYGGLLWYAVPGLVLVGVAFGLNYVRYRLLRVEWEEGS